MHYSEKLSAFLNHELPEGERQRVGEHLLHCLECRREHDEIKLGVELAQNLERADAPGAVWNKIENSLNAKIRPAETTFFHPRRLAFAVILLTLLAGAAATVYLKFSDAKPHEIAEVKTENPPLENPAGWQVENISDETNSSKNDFLKVGEILETGDNSRAKIEVADIGQVEVAPNSLVKLINSSDAEHRLALEYGTLDAKIFAPPRLFVVDTPTATAVDLGCAYKLEVDRAGNSKLRVTSGYVALERDGLESIVPAGAFCLTKRGKGLGTPAFETASAKFKADLQKFDFEDGGEKRLDAILKNAAAKDTLTLWHLLRRVSGAERERVFARINSFTKLPAEATREGILRLDKEMLDAWRYELELSWYE